MRMTVSAGTERSHRFFHVHRLVFVWRLSFIAVVVQHLVSPVNAHVAPWHKGMYCLNGTNPGMEDQDTNSATQPLYMLNKTDWWFHHSNMCDQFPPAPGDFLELPANGEFTVELAVNRAFTTLSYNGTRAGLYTGGEQDPGLGITQEGKAPGDDCITNPNIHTQNETMAAGTAFAISYVSDLIQVTEENLVVFTVLYHTPWRRLATYQVPNLPACPEPQGCICAWGWVANGCGEPNMYMLPYRCRVTGTTGSAVVAKAIPPTWCEDNSTNCSSGSRQLIYWHQLEGNNVVVSGNDMSGQPKSPGYNMRMGFKEGAQTDIFSTPGSATATEITPALPSSTTPVKSKALKNDIQSHDILLAILALCVRAFI